MNIKPIAHSYWRSVQAGSRSFAQVRPEVQEDVRFLARRDVQGGAITPDRYLELIGEPFEEGV